MQRHPVSSSSIRSVAYDRERAVLSVEFVHGSTYAYFDVPPETHERFLAAESKGRFFNSEVRSRHRHQLLHPVRA
jgi:KTSC domain